MKSDTQMFACTSIDEVCHLVGTMRAGGLSLVEAQTLIIHILRSEWIPFIQRLASLWLTVISAVVVAFGIWLTVSPYAGVLGFVSLPATYWPILGALLVCYAVCAQAVKGWVVHFAPHIAPTMARRPPGRPGQAPV